MQPMVEATAKMLPGSVEASFHLAKILYLSSDLSNAQNNCSACLKIDPSFSKAHILMAQINVASNQPKLAIQSLEASMSYNFQVRNMPMFHIIKAKALKMQGLYDEALSTLNTAMSLPGIKTEIKSKNENCIWKRYSLQNNCLNIGFNPPLFFYFQLKDSRASMMIPSPQLAIGPPCSWNVSILI